MIIVIVRTLNEAHNIVPFCYQYSKIADKILVADGGSHDDTLEGAAMFSKVEIRHFDERTELENGYWRNNDSDHINFLIEWAKEHDPEWIIMDDCDCRPNFLLQKDARGVLKHTAQNVVMTCRVYLYGHDQHFPHMMKLKPTEEFNYMTSLWAWKPETDLWTKDNDFPHYTLMIGDEIAGDLHKSTSVLDLMPPYGLIHYTWADEARLLEKIRIHQESGSIPGQLHPTLYAGPLEPRPSWAYE
jgi:hypothetical protein